MGLFAGRLGQRYGSRTVLPVGIVISTVGYLGFSLAHNERWHICLPVKVMGSGFGGAFGSMSNLIVAANRGRPPA